MSAAWAKVSFGDLTRLERRSVDVIADRQYQEIGTYSYGRGIFHKQPRSGLEVGSKDLFLMKEGDLILQVTFAWEGAIALCSKAEDGLYGSVRYPTFRVNEDRCFAPFLAKYLCIWEGLEQIRRICPGSAGRNRVLAIKRLPEITIPLPPLDEQRRIVARVEQLATKVEEARACRAKATDLRDGFVESFIGQRFAELEPIYPARTFGSCGAHVSSGPRNWGKNYTSSGLRFYRAQDIDRSFQISDENVVYVERPPGSQGQSAIVSDGDLLIVITGATVGRAAVYDNNQSPGLVSQHVAVCRIPSASFHPRFVLWGLRGPHGQKQLLGSKYGQGKPGLNLGQVRGLSLPCPPIDVQVKISGELDALQSKVDSVKALHCETAAELDAMLPAILDRAFKGEL
jgi:type I restriction enzyme S subunit